MPRCLIGCGSNQGARREQLDRAIELLGVMPGVRLEAVSRHRETRPVGGPPDQPPFLNGACLIDTELGPHELLGLLAAVENTLHRDRSERWGPRTVDLDLLLYDDVVIDDETVAGAALTVPHPRMATRRFVLEPAVEIAPDLHHPVSGCSLRDLLDNISAPHLHVCVVGVPGTGAAEVAGAIADATLARHLHARVALPRDQRRLAPWIAALSTLAAPLRVEDWPSDAQATVSDYWLGAVPVAAEGILPAPQLAALVARHAETSSSSAAPHVAIFLRLSPMAIAERVALGARTRGGSSELCADLGDHDAESLAGLQERLLARLRCRSGAARPPALVVVEADELPRAVDEAIAAVEAAG